MALIQSLKAQPSSLIGGNVVGLLLRQAILLRKLRLRQRQFVKGEILSNPLIYVFGAVPVTARKQEVYNYTAEVTKHAVEDGSIYTDHVILQPIQIDLSFEISNFDPQQVKYSFNLLVEIWKQRVPFDLITEQQKVPNVIILTMKLINTAPLWNTIDVQASFQQLSVIKLEMVDFPIDKVKYPEVVEGQTRPPEPDVSKSLQSTVNTGLTTPATPSQSTLFGLFQ